MSPKLCLVFTVFAVCAAVASADIFGDLIGWDVIGAFTGESTKEVKKRPASQREDEEVGIRGCQCEGMGCNCCVDFNLTSIIDLGGPGCVRMRYISKEEGVKLNVSYGDSLLHSQTVTQNDKKGSCMDLLSEFAQICARFADLKSVDDGLEGCLNFEPHVLGEVTSQYPVGCFRMGPDGMVQDPSLAPQEEEEKPSETNTQESEDEESSSSILDVVNQSAEQGIAFISDLFGFKVPGTKAKPATDTVTTETASAAAEEGDEDDEGDGDSEDTQEESSRKLSGILLGRHGMANDV